MGHYGPPSTGSIQELAYNTNHKQGATTKLFKLLHNKYFLTVTLRIVKTIRVSLLDFDSIRSETRKLSYRKHDRAMGALKIFESPLSTPTATFADVFNGLLF